MIIDDTYAVLAGKKIRELRKEAGYTISEFAKLADCKSEQQLYRYERGVNKIGIDELVAALKVLNINIGEFFERLEKEIPVADEVVNIDKEKHYSETHKIIKPSSSVLLVGSC
ncbi:helix-turn-helix domain-containing protein [Providencia heimbachae]|uniref:helix-turn-helix domain-containing protein n=1 Tax=Providencia heimbachae TaxID=333962 RepID=UPI002240C485|nr:helix-turn-helix transcriptional regulator [Providencia heimbachae]